MSGASGREEIALESMEATLGHIGTARSTEAGGKALKSSDAFM